ncbi:MAG: MATE family efflux transporter, partial [Clostridium butyricum]|nr:MATE family efflux transporter [Clostridium butyricum]
MSKDMTIGNPSKILFYFAIPMVLGNILQQLYNIVDSMIVGNFVGADALATVVQVQKIRHIFHMCLYFFLYSSDTSSNSSI